MSSSWSIRGRLFGLWLLMLIMVSVIVYWSTNAVVERSLPGAGSHLCRSAGDLGYAVRSVHQSSLNYRTKRSRYSLIQRRKEFITLFPLMISIFQDTQIFQLPSLASMHLTMTIGARRLGFSFRASQFPRPALNNSVW